MAAYLVVLSIACCFAVLSLSLPLKLALFRGPLAVASALILMLFIGLRDQVGTDWYVYEDIYKSVIDAPFIIGLFVTEPGYAICNYLANLVGADLHLVNLLCAALMTGGLLRFAMLTKIDPCFMLFLSSPYLLFVVGMGYTRQSVAIGLGFWAIGYLSQGRYKLFYVLAFCATCFHFSALALILFVWLRTWRRLLVLAVLILALSPLILATLALPRYGQYLDEQSSGVWLRLAIIFLGLGCVFMQRGYWKKDPRIYSILIKCSILSMIFVPLALLDSTLVDRLGLYLIFIYLIAIGRSIRYSRPEFRWLAFAASAGISYGVLVLWFSVSQYAALNWIPYRIAVN